MEVLETSPRDSLRRNYRYPLAESSFALRICKKIDSDDLLICKFGIGIVAEKLTSGNHT